jgi:hypothetical protein
MMSLVELVARGRGGLVGDLGEPVAPPDPQALDGGQEVAVGAAVIGVDFDAGAGLVVAGGDQSGRQHRRVGDFAFAFDLDHAHGVPLSPRLIAA